ncbi:MAG: hypothetical protein ACPGVV_00510 [Croceimicrobium sp.]
MIKNLRASSLSSKIKLGLSGLLAALLIACQGPKDKNASEILGHPDYPAIAYGGYRNVDRSQAPSIDDIKEDLILLDVMGIRVLRTYHARLYEHTPNLLRAIREMRAQDPSFEMYVMLGAWMQCEGAFSDSPDHNKPDSIENQAEIDQAIKLAKEYPEIVKVIAVGNESMVHWAASYYVHPRIILKAVNHLQQLKADGELASDLWITSSDNFASWGGGEEAYHVAALDSLIRAVDYLSVHSYPFHDTHYNPNWWWMPEGQDTLPKFKILKLAVGRAVNRVDEQIAAVRSYLQDLGLEKEIHIGETGWASSDNNLYGKEGSGAADEYKQMLYHLWIRSYCHENEMACFYFEAFDEPWKDGNNPGGSENHFGVITVDGAVKMPLWNSFDQGVFEGLSRNGKPIRKSLEGDVDRAIEESTLPPLLEHQSAIRLQRNDSLIEAVSIWGNAGDRAAYGADAFLTISPWESTCKMIVNENQELLIIGGTGDWWGGSCSLKAALDLSEFSDGYMELDICGSSEATFQIGFQSGQYNEGDQEDAFISIGPKEEFHLEPEIKRIRVALKNIKAETNLSDVRSPLFIKGLSNFDGKEIRIKRMAFTRF